MDEEANGGVDQGDDPPEATRDPDAPGLSEQATVEAPTDELADDEVSPGDEIIDLPWDEELPVALGEDAGPHGSAGGELEPEALDDAELEDDTGERAEAYFAERRRITRRGVDSWRNRTATGAIATAIAMGLQQVFEPEKRRPAAVAEAPSDPYDDDDPITVDYVPDDAEATTVHVKPWLLQKGDP